MGTVEVVDALFELLGSSQEDLEGFEDEGDIECHTFSSAGILTNDSGLVLTIGDRKFHITITEAR